MSDFTPWYPRDTRPARKGVYQIDSEFCYSYWNGKRWSFATATAAGAMDQQHEPSHYQYRIWRGLASKP